MRDSVGVIVQNRLNRHRSPGLVFENIFCEWPPFRVWSPGIQELQLFHRHMYLAHKTGTYSWRCGSYYLFCSSCWRQGRICKTLPRSRPFFANGKSQGTLMALTKDFVFISFPWSRVQREFPSSCFLQTWPWPEESGVLSFSSWNGSRPRCRCSPTKREHDKHLTKLRDFLHSVPGRWGAYQGSNKGGFPAGNRSFLSHGGIPDIPSNHNFFWKGFL